MRTSPIWSLPVRRALSYAVLWHPLYRKQLRDFVEIADESKLVDTTASGMHFGAIYGLGLGSAGSAVMFYAKGIIPLGMFIPALAVACMLIIVAARGLARVKKEINTTIASKRRDSGGSSGH